MKLGSAAKNEPELNVCVVSVVLCEALENAKNFALGWERLEKPYTGNIEIY